MNMIRVSEEAFYATEVPVIVGDAEIAKLKAELHQTKRKRIRLCTHPNVNAPLHEMFVLYCKETKIGANKHFAKDETFYVMEGFADLVFFNDTGDVTQIVQLGPYGSGNAFSARIPHDTWHDVVVSSDYLLLHETTPGPYIRDHTIWAPWSK